MNAFSARLRTRIVLMALIAVAPAIVAVVASQVAERRQERNRGLDDSVRLARLAAVQTGSVLDDAQRLLATLSDLPEIRGDDVEACRAVLARVLFDHPRYFNLGVSDSEGALVCAGTPLDPRFDTAGPSPWLTEALRTMATVVGPLQVSATTGKLALTMAYPLRRRRDGKVRVVAASIGLEQFQAIAADLSLPPGTTTTVFDRDRHILARVPDGPTWIGRTIADAGMVHELAGGAHEDLREDAGVDGVRRLYVTVPIRASFQTGMYLGLGIEDAVAFAEADRQMRRYLWLLAFMSLAVVAGAVAAGEWFVVRPMTALSAVTARLADGDLGARVQIATAVLGVSDLGSAIDSMAAALELRETDLRTSEERHRLLFRQNPLPLWVFDAETLRFLEVNDAAVAHYGYSRDEFLAMRVTDIRPPEDVPLLVAELARPLEERHRVRRWRHRLKSGERIEVEISSTSFDFNGRPARLVLAHDVTARVRAEQERRLLAAIVEDSEDAIVGKTLDGTIVSWNAGAEKLYGYTAAEVIGRSISIVMPEDRADELTDLLRRLAAGEHLKQYQSERRHKDGTRIPVSLTLSPMRDPSGRIVGASAITRDISQRLRAEQALRTSEERFRRIAETVSEVFWISDVDARSIVYISPAYERIWGRTCESLYRDSRSFLDSVHPDDRARLLVALGSQEAGQLYECEYRIVRPDGDARWIWDRGYPVRDAAGRVVQYVGSAQDITGRVSSARALAEAEERMRFALDASHVGIWETELVTDRSYWSNTCQAMHGLLPGSFGGTMEAFAGCIHPEDRDAVVRSIGEAADRRSELELEYRTIWPDGSVHKITSTGRFFYDDAGRPLRGAGVAIDVTDRRSLEDQLRQAQKMEAVGQLAGGIAHDFNNMLTAILGNAEFVKDGLAPDDPGRADVDEITKAATRAAALTHQLLAFSRKQVLAPRVLRIGDTVSEITPMLRRLLGETIDLRTTMSDRGHVMADSVQLEQVLMNLAVNARDAMQSGGRLTIDTADVEFDAEYAQQHPSVRAGDYVMVAVSDTGHGMDAATRERIFEPFFTTKPVGQGTGLGLATVHGIVNQSGGHIWVYSEIGRGTTFKLYLPRTDAQESFEHAAALDTRALTGSESILLVEDEEVVREFVFKVLTRQGYSVQAAGTPGRAIAFAEAHHGPIDLLLTDVVLPEMSGRALAEAIGRSHPEAVVLYTSGYTDDAIVHHGVLEEGMSFLQKPFTNEAIVRKVRDVLDARARTAHRDGVSLS